MEQLIQDNNNKQDIKELLFVPQSISFLHGLECGYNGTKHKYLKKNYKTCYFVSMEMSKWKLNKRNSFLRTLIKNFFRPSRAVEDSLKGCLAIQEAELKINKPDIILGSSWGGAIGLLLVSEGIWDGPIVLCCPALKHLLDTVGQTPNFKWNEIVEKINKRNMGKNILIIHGTSDKIVPYENSVDCVKQIKDCQLITIENGNHGLTKFILKTDKLKNIINNFYNQYMLSNLK
ncbi:hypothetical protein ABPG74_008733 [Tetrahymena malaccensis]